MILYAWAFIMDSNRIFILKMTRIYPGKKLGWIRSIMHLSISYSDDGEFCVRAHFVYNRNRSNCWKKILQLVRSVWSSWLRSFGIFFHLHVSRCTASECLTFQHGTHMKNTVLMFIVLFLNWLIHRRPASFSRTMIWDFFAGLRSFRPTVLKSRWRIFPDMVVPRSCLAVIFDTSS